MPAAAPLPKVAATRAYGAQIRHAGGRWTRRSSPRRSSPARTGAVLIHPFDHFDIVAGQGTVGLELVEQCPDVKTVVVCTGGGGLIAGIAVAVKALRPTCGWWRRRQPAQRRSDRHWQPGIRWRSRR
jgi:threonine dehydratase